MNCPICQTLMMQPYTCRSVLFIGLVIFSLMFSFAHSLKGCGHACCEGCLATWFTQSLREHRILHPNYKLSDRDIPARLIRLVEKSRRHPDNFKLKATIKYQLLQYRCREFWRYAGNGIPSYTCPICRASVDTAPIRDYTLKALVEIFSGSEGGARDAINHWEQFFHPYEDV